MNSEHKKQLFIALRYSYFVILAGMITAIIILQVRNHRIQLERITALEVLMETMRQEMAEMQEEIVQQIKTETAIIGEQILGVNNRIQRVEKVYAELLSAQYRRTLDSLYKESDLVEKKQLAAKFFTEGNYAAASEEYAVIAQARPEDFEARFYQWYSLFLVNKMDMNNYKQIKEVFKKLEQSGYRRKEIREVLEYIEKEEGGLSKLTEDTR
ncbi:MAG: hypothetical protein LBV17_01925 [Treponema sp.]|jgi:hypothetical protein|nr:hypothetical protein [Treponema sp.]